MEATAENENEALDEESQHEESTFVTFLKKLSEKASEVLEALGWGGDDSLESSPPKSSDESQPSDEQPDDEEGKPTPKPGSQLFPTVPFDPTDPKSCDKYKDKEPTIFFLCNILCTQLQQFKQLENIATKLGAEKVKEKPCSMPDKKKCKSSDDTSDRVEFDQDDFFQKVLQGSPLQDADKQEPDEQEKHEQSPDEPVIPTTTSKFLP